MSLKLYVVRHGQAVSNIEKKAYDDFDAELTMNGRMQAMGTGKKLKALNVEFDAIYCSKLERARETCAIALESAGWKKRKKEVHYLISLRERDLKGIYGVSFDADYWKELQYFTTDAAEKAGIETFDHLENRAKNFICAMKKKFPNGGNILVFTHGLLDLAFFTSVYGRPASGTTYDLNLLNNGEFRVYEIE